MLAKAEHTRDIAAMTDGPAPAKTPKKRGKGRPVPGNNDVGRERLLAATERLLRVMPPARVTIARIAQEANADPALVRYYFTNRASLLVAVVARVPAHAQRAEAVTSEPVMALAGHIARTVQLVRRAPFLHRLIVEELAQEGTDESRARVRDMNLDLIAFYRALLAMDDGRELIDANPLLLWIAVLGASDFFSSAEPLMRELLPKGTNMKKLTAEFETFLVGLVLNGLRKR